MEESKHNTRMLPLFQDLLDSSLATAYKDFKLVCDMGYYAIFNATSINDNQVYSIRALNNSSPIYQKNSELAATRFIQELFYLMKNQPDLVLIELFSIKKSQMMAVTKGAYTTLANDPLIQKKSTNGIVIDLKKMLTDVLLNLQFLKSGLNLKHTIEVGLEKILKVESSTSDTRYYLGDWLEPMKEEGNQEDSKLLELQKQSDISKELAELARVTKRLWEKGTKLTEKEAFSNSEADKSGLSKSFTAADLNQLLDEMANRDTSKRLQLDDIFQKLEPKATTEKSAVTPKEIIIISENSIEDTKEAAFLEKSETTSKEICSLKLSLRNNDGYAVFLMLV